MQRKRISRSVLSVPATNWRMIEKAVSLPEDLVLLDLEDAVAPDHKVGARQTVVRALHELDFGARVRAFRCNGLDTPYFYRDVIDIVEQAGASLDAIVIPKVQRSEDLVVVDTLLTQIESNVGLTPGGITIHAQIESARGLIHVEAIARSTRRLEALVFGPGDYAGDIRMPAESIGGTDDWDRAYPGHRLHYAMQKILVAARSEGLSAIDGPVADHHDRDGFQRSCGIARSLGFDGKWCIHPDQIEPANAAFSPTERELAWARRVIDAYKEAVAAGRGAISLDGIMIDRASIRLADATLEGAERANMV
ncbi:MAG: CoA ester lyase [Chloroflexota bacterium]